MAIKQVKPPTTPDQVTRPTDADSLLFDLRDIELVLKHLMASDFRGSEIQQAYITMTKLRQLHATMASQGVNINASGTKQAGPGDYS